jgi:hypothetical protein
MQGEAKPNRAMRELARQIIREQYEQESECRHGDDLAVAARGGLRGLLRRCIETKHEPIRLILPD